MLPNKKVRYTITNFNEHPEIEENQIFYANETQMRHGQTKEGLADQVFFWRERNIYIYIYMYVPKPAELSVQSA